MPFNRAKPKKLSDNPIIARFLANTSNLQIDSIFRSPFPLIAKFKTRAKDGHFILSSRIDSPTSNTVHLGYDSTSNESYISLDANNKIITLNPNSVNLNAPTKVLGNIIPHTKTLSSYLTSNFNNAYFSYNLNINKSTISNHHSNIYLTTSNNPAQINAKEIRIRDSESGYYTVLSTGRTGLNMTAYTSNHQLIKHLNIGDINTSMFPENLTDPNPKLYMTNERTVRIIVESNLPVPEASNFLIEKLQEQSVILRDSINLQEAIIEDYLDINSNQLEQNTLASITDQYPHLIDYIQITSNLIPPIITDTSNVLQTFVTDTLYTTINQNISNYIANTTDIFLNSTLPETSNNLVTTVSLTTDDTNRSTSNSSNINAQFITTTSNTIISKQGDITSISSNFAAETSNTLLINLDSRTTELTTLRQESIAAINQQLDTASNNIVTNLNQSSNYLRQQFVTTNTYNNIIPLVDATSNILMQPFPAASNQLATYINNITMEQLNQGPTSTFIVNNQYPYPNLTASNLTTIGNIIPSSLLGNLGSSSTRWRDLYISSDSINIGDIKLTASQQSQLQILNTKTNKNTETQVKTIKLADKTNTNFMELKYDGKWITTTAYDSEGTSLTRILRRTDDTPEGSGTPEGPSSNLYFTASRMASVVSASNIITSNYAMQKSNTVSTKITNLTADQIKESDFPINRFIKNKKYNTDLTVFGTLTTSNLNLKNREASILNTKTLDYQQLILRNPAKPNPIDDTPVFTLFQKKEQQDIISFNSNIIIKSTGFMGIGTSGPTVTERLEVYGSINLSDALNTTSSNAIASLQNIKSSPQAQLNIKKVDLSTANNSRISAFTLALATLTTQTHTDNGDISTTARIYASSNFDYHNNRIEPSLNPLYPYITSLDSNASNYISSISSNLLGILSQSSNNTSDLLAPLQPNISNYLSDTSNASINSLINSSNRLSNRINYMTATSWIPTSLSDQKFIYFNSNILISNNPWGASEPSELLEVVGNFRADSLNGIQAVELSTLKGIQSSIQQQIDDIDRNNSNYILQHSNLHSFTVQTMNTTFSATVISSNSQLQQHLSSTYASMNQSLATTSNDIQARINNFRQRGYTNWTTEPSQSSIYITDKNVCIGTSNAAQSDLLTVANGNVNITNGQATRISFDRTLIPAVWYQFNQNPTDASNTYLLDSGSANIKYNLVIPSTTAFTSNLGYKTNNNNTYLYKNAYQWTTNTSLTYTAAPDPALTSLYIKNLLSTFSTANGFSIHFLFKTNASSQTVQYPIFYIGYTLSNSSHTSLIYAYILNSSLYFKVNNITVLVQQLQPLQINRWYIADLTVSISNNQMNIEACISNTKAATAISTYDNWLNVSDPDAILTFRLGSNPNPATNSTSAPIALQDFRIFPFVLSSSQISALQYGNDSITTTIDKYQIVIWKDSPSYYSATDPKKFITYNSGNVGIGLSNPETYLHIASGIIDTITSEVAYFNLGQTNVQYGTPNLNNICAIFESSILVSGKVSVSSDIRIKKNIIDINDDSALQKILTLQPKTYNYIVDASEQPLTYGFIAQQVKEVLPEAVTQQKEFIPNIYTTAIMTSSNTIQLPSDAQLPSTNIIIEGEKYTILAIDSDTHTITVDKDINITNCSDNTDIGNKSVFVFGTEVDDFNTLNKSYLYTLNVCATQTLSHKIQQMRQRVSNIKIPLS